MGSIGGDVAGRKDVLLFMEQDGEGEVENQDLQWRIIMIRFLMGFPLYLSLQGNCDLT